jgi:membrane protease YdiL (CAAX protease family)
MRGRSIVEVAAVFVLLAVLQYAAPGVAGLMRWESRVLGESYFVGLLTLTLPLLAIVASKGSFEDYGLSVSGWEPSVGRGLTGYLCLLLPNSVVFVMGLAGVSLTYLPASVFVSGVTLLAMFLTLKRISKPRAPKNRRNLVAVAALAVSPLVLSALVGGLSLRLASSLIWELVFGGAAEEVFYRGYVQSRVNGEFGRPWRLMGVGFGPGLLVSSLLYGVAGAMSTFRPWRGLYAIGFAVGVHAVALGVFYGFMREAAGDVGASTVANGLNDAVGRLLLRALS